MRGLSTLSVLFAVLACCPGSADAQPSHMLNRMRRADSNLLGPQPVVRIPWQDLSTRSVDDAWLFRLTIDEQGHVVKSVVLEGPLKRREQAMALATALRFRPFVRDGRAEAVDLDFIVPVVVEDYVGPPDRAFALASTKPADVRIALSRTECFGSCPSYWLEVRGDGRVTYRGHGDVLVEGRHHWRVKPAAVAALVERFRQTDYFKLKGYYAADVSDAPTYVTRLSVGRQQKFVLDYGGEMGDALEAPASNGAAVPRMPSVVTELENAIDAVAGAGSWVQGDAKTMAMLRKQNWNFRSQAAGRGLGVLIRHCNTALAAEFVKAGAPVNAEVAFSGMPVVAAAYCGDVALIRLLAGKGALSRPADALGFLEASARRGFPALVAVALEHGVDVGRSTVGGKPLIATAAGAMRSDERMEADSAFDPAQVIEKLLQAGSDPNARDGMGKTALHWAGTTSAARALVRGGADVNAVDNDGNTPLETADDEAVALALLAAGAALPADPARLAALGQRAADRQWKELLPMLVASAGAAAALSN
jgi:hypothetical protein